MKRPEILAPAGSMESLRAAVAAGCDAVYIGGSSFGARAYADNLSEEGMIEAIGYCHLHGVKIYMTVNTLFKEQERCEQLYRYLLPYYKAGLDAVIVQDMGAMDLIREYFPELDIHASTQMALTMGRGTEWLKKYHVNRIVPARELSLDELRQMRDDTALELEVFVHGALCYCYSGQCLFSSMLGGRSGNRGRCAQPCRMAYHAEGLSDSQGSYLLSPKELCNLEHIGELIDIGIDSFKIEGRMKRPEYTAFVTAVYRKYTDYYCSMGKQEYEQYLRVHFQEWEQDMRHLSELYNRSGFTSGYLQSRAGNVKNRRQGSQGDMLSRMRPKHGGVLVGEVLSVGKREVVYQAIEEIFPQDVVEFRDRMEKQIYEYTLGERISVGQKVTARYQRGCKIQPGDKVYRTRHQLLLEQIRQEYLDKKKQEPVEGIFCAVQGKPMTLTVQCGDNIVTCHGEICERAAKQPAEPGMVERYLNQTGGSPFFFDRLTLEMEENLFLPVGALKKLRRNALEELKNVIISQYYRNTEKPYECAKIYECSNTECGSVKDILPEKAVSVMNLSQLEAVLERGDVDRVYVYTEELSSDQLVAAYEKITSNKKQAYLAMPRIFRQGIRVRWEKGLREKDSFLLLPWAGYLVKNQESLHFLRDNFLCGEGKIVLDYHMYVMNDGSAVFWQREGIDAFTLPVELTAKELAQLSFLPQSELVVYGRLPLMVSAQCMLKNTSKCACREDEAKDIFFSDSKKRRFFSRNCCKYCYSVIYKEEALMLGRKQWDKLPVCRIRYDFVNESSQEIGDILAGTAPGEVCTGHWNLGIE